jgi:hypothetical protein
MGFEDFQCFDVHCSQHMRRHAVDAVSFAQTELCRTWELSVVNSDIAKSVKCLWHWNLSAHMATEQTLQCSRFVTYRFSNTSLSPKALGGHTDLEDSDEYMCPHVHCWRFLNTLKMLIFCEEEETRVRHDASFVSCRFILSSARNWRKRN